MAIYRLFDIAKLYVLSLIVVLGRWVDKVISKGLIVQDPYINFMNMFTLCSFLWFTLCQKILCSRNMYQYSKCNMSVQIMDMCYLKEIYKIKKLDFLGIYFISSKIGQCIYVIATILHVFLFSCQCFINSFLWVCGYAARDCFLLNNPRGLGGSLC